MPTPRALVLLLLTACSPATVVPGRPASTPAVLQPTAARPAPHPVTCGDHTCAGATPICCQSGGQATCRAADACPSEPSTIPMGCTDNRDCGDQRCCLHTSPRGPTFTTCSTAAQCPARTESAVALPMCATQADCPSLANGRNLVGCQPVTYFEQRFCLYE